jgi:hypothetical protein
MQIELIPRGRGDAISLLFALRKKERYEAKGFIAFVHHGVFMNDERWEVYVMPKARSCPACQGTGRLGTA